MKCRRNRKQNAVARKRNKADMRAAVMVLIGFVGIILLVTLIQRVGWGGEFASLILGKP